MECAGNLDDKRKSQGYNSGIAATLLFLGQTTHHRFKLPLTPHKDSVCNFKKESEIGRILSEISLGIIDEGPMLNKLYLEALDQSLKDLVPAEDKEKKFGGKIILVSGDFWQLLPVLEKASRAEIVNHTLRILLLYGISKLSNFD